MYGLKSNQSSAIRLFLGSSKTKVKIAVFNLFLQIFYDTVSNKKTHLAVFETCVFSHISPEPLELQKSYLHLFISLPEEHSEKKFSIPVTKPADICKNAVLPEKSKLLKKICNFERFKNFHGSKA